MRIFVFAVGGTGVRVLRSLTMLLAAGCKLPKDTTIVPIILDYDLVNGDTAIAGNVLQYYQTIRRRALKDTPYKEDAFFGTPVVRLDQIPVANGVAPNIGKNFHVSVEGADNTFGHYIGYDLLTKGETDDEDLSATKELLNALYNNDPQSPGRELHLKLNVGFKGNPNIGAVVFDRWIESKEFRFFGENVGRDDRIFIISSLFGGTGASGFPKLVQSMRDSDKTNVQEAKIGAAVVMPYFRFGDDEQSAITASVFNSKTKAALSYYKTSGLNEKINAIYYLSDKVDQAEGTYNNVEGGADQKNQAHITELLAATSIIDFANRDDDDLDAGSVYEFGAKEWKGCLNISHFPDITQMKYLDNLSRLTYFLQFYKKMLPSVPKNAAYAVSLNLTAIQLKGDTFYRTLNDFFDEYKQWLTELEENTMRKFKPYNLDAPTRELLAHRKLKKNLIGEGPLKDDFFHERMTKYHHEHQPQIPDNEHLFLKVARDTMNDTLEYAKTH